LKLFKEKKVDMIMVHAPAAEKQAVLEGWATSRKLIGSNEFYIVGPKTDPASIAKATSAADAYARIAAAQSKFYSRGDNSGTHKKEMDIWQKAGIQPAGESLFQTRNESEGWRMSQPAIMRSWMDSKRVCLAFCSRLAASLSLIA
jgi:tungstate transport system substrate-binding protein